MSKAFDRVQKLNEALLAELIAQDVQQLTEKALDKGVTAYLERPVQRERPNERFLQNTLRGVASTNRRVEERQLWDVHRSQHRRHEPVRQRQRSDSESDTPSGSSNRDGSPMRSPAVADEVEGGIDDVQLLNLLARKRVKGRGAIGPCFDEPGPYLPQSSERGRDREDDLPAARPQQGPAAPEWIRRPVSPTMPAERPRLLSAANPIAGAGGETAKKPKKDKKRKHKRKEKDSEKSRKRKRLKQSDG